MMKCKHTIHSKDDEVVSSHEFEMAGEHHDRAIDYTRKTIRRRWAEVPWFKSLVLTIHDEEGVRSAYYVFVVDNDPKVTIINQGTI